MQTIEAIIDEHGAVRLLEPVHLRAPRRAIVTILENESFETALLSEQALAEDWNRPEENAAWVRFQRDQ